MFTSAVPVLVSMPFQNNSCDGVVRLSCQRFGKDAVSFYFKKKAGQTLCNSRSVVFKATFALIITAVFAKVVSCSSILSSVSCVLYYVACRAVEDCTSIAAFKMKQIQIIFNFVACVFVAYSLRKLFISEQDNAPLFLGNFSSDPFANSIFDYILQPRLERNVFSFPESFMTTASFSLIIIKPMFYFN